MPALASSHPFAQLLSSGRICGWALLLIAGCAGSSAAGGGTPAPGAEQGACVDGDLCDFGLTCVAKVCVPGPWGDEGSDAGPPSSSGGGASGAGGSTAARGGATSAGGVSDSTGGRATSAGGASTGGTASGDGGATGSGGTTSGSGGTASGGATSGAGGALGAGGGPSGSGGVLGVPVCTSGTPIRGQTCAGAFCYCSSGSYSGKCVLKSEAGTCCPGGC